MKVIMALSHIICLVLATVVCISGLSIDESINDAYEASGRHYSFSPRHGSVIAELDMRLRREEWEALYGRHRAKRMTHKSSDKLWSNKTIPYLISNMFVEDQRTMIEESMEVWANNTCLEFREKTRGDRNYVAFTDAIYGCSSAVGMEGGRQRIALATACLKKEVLIHEVGHAIGLYHEHARPDRDDYITVNTSNIDREYLNQFNKALWDNIEMHDVSYDLRSIMHYGKMYFSINGKPTIIPKDLTFIDIIGNSKNPSFSDFKAVNLMYRCQEHCPTRVCPCDGFMGKDCQCMCPGDPTRGEPPLIRCVGGCKYDITDTVGEINSPNWPEIHPARKDCVWHITATPGHRVRLTFNRFELEPHAECTYDYLEVFDGENNKARSLGKFCGSKIPDPIVASLNQLYVAFYTDDSDQRNGFHATHNTVCGGNLNATPKREMLYSHAKYGDQNYDNEQHCDWVISATPGFRVRFRFYTFEVENEEDCRYDYVEVYDGMNTSDKYLGRRCASQVPQEIISSGRYLMIRFVTDDAVNLKGFSAYYVVAGPNEKPVTHNSISETYTRVPPSHKPKKTATDMSHSIVTTTTTTRTGNTTSSIINKIFFTT